ncbi:MAG TPA: hypothetical protein VIR27_14980 [Mycobacteriales bacterium]|jgi:hypothetical protein
MKPSLIGVVVGIALGFAGAFGGWGAFLIVGLLTAVGYLVGRVVQGDLDLTPYLSGRTSARERSRR